MTGDRRSGFAARDQTSEPRQNRRPSTASSGSVVGERWVGEVGHAVDRRCAAPQDVDICARDAGAVPVYQNSHYWPIQDVVVAIMIVLSALALALGRLRLRRVV